MQDSKQRSKNPDSFRFLASVFVFSILVFGLALSVSAKSYEAYLFKTGDNQIVFDRDYTEHINLTDQDTVTQNESGDFFAEFYSTRTNVPVFRYTLADFSPGKYTLEMPYMANVAKIEIKTAKDEKAILTIDTSKFITCNNNSICEKSLGENEKTCYADCFLENYQVPAGAGSSKQGNGTLMLVLLIIGIVGALLIIVYIFRSLMRSHLFNEHKFLLKFD